MEVKEVKIKKESIFYDFLKLVWDYGCAKESPISYRDGCVNEVFFDHFNVVFEKNLFFIDFLNLAIERISTLGLKD